MRLYIYIYIDIYTYNYQKRMFYKINTRSQYLSEQRRKFDGYSRVERRLLRLSLNSQRFRSISTCRSGCRAGNQYRRRNDRITVKYKSTWSTDTREFNTYRNWSKGRRVGNERTAAHEIEKFLHWMNNFSTKPRIASTKSTTQTDHFKINV